LAQVAVSNVLIMQIYGTLFEQRVNQRSRHTVDDEDSLLPQTSVCRRRNN
jgi:hypothetical protein